MSDQAVQDQSMQRFPNGYIECNWCHHRFEPESLLPVHGDPTFFEICQLSKTRSYYRYTPPSPTSILTESQQIIANSSAVQSSLWEKVMRGEPTGLVTVVLAELLAPQHQAVLDRVTGARSKGPGINLLENPSAETLASLVPFAIMLAGDLEVNLLS